MHNNLNFIKNFPNKIKKINIKQLERNKNLDSINIEKLTTISLDENNLSNNILVAQSENKLHIFDSNLNIQNILYPSFDDNIEKFGYSIFRHKHQLFTNGFTKEGFPLIYVYNIKNNFELEYKFMLQNLKGEFYPTFINNKLIIIKQEIKHLVLYSFRIIDDLLEKDDIIKIELSQYKPIFSTSNKHLFINSKEQFYIIDIINYKILIRENKACKAIETLLFPNIELTVVAHDIVEVYDDKLNIRQQIDLPNIDMICFSDSYLILGDTENNIIHILALNHNGLFIEFGKISHLQNISQLNCINNIIVFNNNNEYLYAKLPQRIYNLVKFNGYGYYVYNQNIQDNKGNPIFLKDGKLTTYIEKDSNISLIIGYTKFVSELIVPDHKKNMGFSIEYSFHEDENTNLKKNYILISENIQTLDSLTENIKTLSKENTNFIFIEETSSDIYLKSTIGSSIKIKVGNYDKIITWSKNSILKLELFNNDSLIEINTNSDIDMLGYQVKSNNKFNYQVIIVSNSNDVIINSAIVNNYNTFFPYLKENKINGIVNNTIKDVDIQFELLPIKSNLPDYNNKGRLEINELNQQFYRRYLLENNDKSIIIKDVLMDKIITEYKPKDLENIKKIIYINPLLIILSKPNNEIDTTLNIVNIKDNKIIPYIISNTDNENLTNIFKYDNDNLVFVTINDTSNIIYIINLDDSNEVNKMRKINFQENIKNIRLFNKYLAVETENKEIILYDIEEFQTLISFTDENLINFTMYYNHLIVLLKEDNLKAYVYKIKPDFELLFTKDIDNIKNKPNIEMGPGRVVIYDENNINLYNFDEINGLENIERIEETFIHYYKNILITKNNESYFNVYKFSPQLNYIDLHVDCCLRLNKMTLKNKENVDKSILNLFFAVNNKSEIKINETEYIKFNTLCHNNSIAKMILEIHDKEEIIIETNGHDIKFCGVIEGELKEKLPCFLPGTLISTPNGEIPIENLKDNDTIYNDKEQEIKIKRVHKWETANFTSNNIPYIIPAHSLKENYPKYDTGVSPFHKIKLPNGDFERVENIKLPFIKQFKNDNGILRSNNFEGILEKIIYYNFILENDKPFIANGLIVESLDKSNPHL
jgi:hypothetical protein